MKNKIKLLLLLIITAMFTLVMFAKPTYTSALSDYVDEDGNTHAGWSMSGSSMDQKTWYFDSDTGDIAGSLSMQGDMSAGTMTNFAIRNIPLVQDDTYTVSATFLPHEGMNTDYETTYGIVLWYKDPNNYIVYWLQTKGQENKNEDAGITVGAWSGNLYGKVNGAERQYWVPSNYCDGEGIKYADGWRQDEFVDMWYDQSLHTHPDLKGSKTSKLGILLTTPVTLVAKSELSTANNEACRKFTLQQKVNNTTKTCLEIYVKGITGSSGAFYTGVGAKKMNCTISNFTISPTKTNFTSGVNSKISAIPSTISTAADIDKVVAARNAYDGLLSLKSAVTSSNVTKLTTGETNCANLFNKKALSLDPENVNEDVFLEIYEYYNYSFNDYIRAKISAQALERYQECYRSYGHTCDYGFDYKTDGTNHWKECLECGNKESMGTHTFDSGKITIQSTCTMEGTKTYTCEICKYEKKESVPKKNHNYSDEFVYGDETHYYQCSCGAKKEESAHDFNDGIITREATCTNAGIKTYTCQTCYFAKEEVLPVISHDYTGGWSGNSSSHWKTCTICKTEKTEVGDHDFDEGVVTKKPTCIELGIKTYTCQTCNATKEESIDYIEHDFAEEWTKTDSTFHWHECSICGERNDNQKHTWDKGVYIVEPQDDVEGIIKYTCEVCLGTKEENTGTLNHTHTFGSDWKYDSTYHWHLADCGHYEISDKAMHDWNEGQIISEPNCLAPGYMLYECNTCKTTKRVKIEDGSHLYADEYSYDTSTHWLVCMLCGHEDLDNTERHIYDEGVITTLPTCSKQGVKTFTCVCGHEKTESVDVTEHSFGSDYNYDNSFHWHSCSECNSVDYDSRVRHNFDEGIVDEPATCSSTGRMVYTCQTCYATKTEIIAKISHNYKTTYDANSTYHYHTCSNCGEMDYTSRVRHSFDDGEVITEATCQAKGEVLYTCSECSYQKISTINTTSHVYEKSYSYDGNYHWYKCVNCDAISGKGSHYWDKGVVVSESTCSTKGSIKHTCIDCGAIKFEYSELDKHSYKAEWESNSDSHWHVCKNCGLLDEKVNHNFDNGTVSKEATCKETGLMTYVCQDCKFEKTQTLNVGAHSYSEKYNFNDKEHWHICSSCNQIDEKTPHYFGQAIVVKAATCLNEGLNKYVCEDCGYEKTEKTPALGHSYSEEYKNDEEMHWHECERCDAKTQISKHFYSEGVVESTPNCQTDGVTNYTCLDCGYVNKVITKASGHKFNELWLNDTNAHWHQCEHCEEKMYNANHSWDAGNVTLEPTEEAEGIRVYTCTICGKTKSEAIAPLPASGCGGSIVSSICAIFTLTGALVFAKKKRRK